MNKTDDDIQELQSRIAFQDATIEDLNQAVIRQADALDALREEVQRLRERTETLQAELSTDEAAAHEPPPHY